MCATFQMSGQTPLSPCAKCGNAIPASAAFCPSCGNPTGAGATVLPAAPPPTMLPTSGGHAQVADAPTMSPTGLVTSLDSPSPRPVGAGVQFVAGQQVGPRYTILKLLGQGGMGAVYQ